MRPTTEHRDCILMGAGPAGLTAAMYLRRFHRDPLVLDAGNSRARWIPESRNCPGFPQGLSGVDLLQRLHDQARQYDVDVVTAEATAITRDGGFLVDTADGRRFAAACVVVATGIVDRLPAMDDVEQAVASGAIRLCAICDAYEETDHRIATFGPPADALAHAVFLRAYSARVTAIADGADFDAAQRAQAAAGGIALLHGTGLAFDGRRCLCRDADGHEHAFDTVYPVMGSRSRSTLATALGAEVDEGGELRVDRAQMTSVDGLYAIGDVVSALNQIAVAYGHAAVAATAIHNRLPPRPRDGSR